MGPWTESRPHVVVESHLVMHIAHVGRFAHTRSVRLGSSRYIAPPLFSKEAREEHRQPHRRASSLDSGCCKQGWPVGLLAVCAPLILCQHVRSTRHLHIKLKYCKDLRCAKKKTLLQAFGKVAAGFASLQAFCSCSRLNMYAGQVQSCHVLTYSRRLCSVMHIIS